MDALALELVTEGEFVSFGRKFIGFLARYVSFGVCEQGRLRGECKKKFSSVGICELAGVGLASRWLIG